MLRYLLRPSVTRGRLSRLPDRKAALELKSPWRDGTTRILFEPLELLEKLAAIIRADLQRRIFEHDVLECPKCGGRLKLLALIEDRDVIEQILSHLDLPTGVPKPLPARAPPDPEQLDLYTDVGPEDL